MKNYTIDIPVTTKINIISDLDINNDVAKVDVENEVLIMNDGRVFRMVNVTGFSQATPSYMLKDIKEK